MEIRTMEARDIEAASAAILADDWGDRRSWFEFAVSQPACRPVVAEVDGAVVGTGVGTANGAVGWVGTIWVAPERRGAGLGRALTDAVIDGLESAGCRTLLLVATPRGRRLYETMGFTVQTEYRIVEAPGLSADAASPGGAEAPPATDTPAHPTVRAFEAADKAAMIALDREATGEDRAHLIERFAAPGTARVVTRDGVVRGFVIRAPWGGGATVVPDIDDALAILRARRGAAGPDKVVRAGLLADNAAGLARLKASGWTDAWGAPRLIRGAPLEWQPTSIWGQFNHALG